MRTKIERAVDYIAGFCDKHEKCEMCPLYDENRNCKLMIIVPCEWDGREYVKGEPRK